MKLSNYLIGLFILLSFVTRAFAEPGTNPVLSRLTMSDLFGALALALGVQQLLTNWIEIGKISGVMRFGMIMIACFFLPIWFSLSLESTLVECVILLFLLLLCVLMYHSYKDRLEDGLIPLLSATVIVAVLVGIYDYGALIVGLPRLFPERTSGEVLSGFRNAGQAGAYFLVMLTILFPLRFSRLYRRLTNRNQWILNIALLACITFIALTGKISAYIGVLVGVIGFVLMKRNIRSIFGLGVGSILVVVIFFNLETVAPTIYKRINYKYQTRINARLSGDISEEGDFITKNLGGAIEAFGDRPFTGTGMGAFYGNYAKHEVHSTYFKMLGETGLIGTIGYSLFMLALIGLFRRRKWRAGNPYADYLYAMLPFVFGCLVSWAYTYHLRKREFWIMLAVLLIVNQAAIKYHELVGLEHPKNEDDQTNETVEVAVHPE